MGKNKILLGFVVGAAIGGIAALLVAPDKGISTRENLIDSSANLLRRFKASYNSAIDNVTSVLDSVAEETDEEHDSLASANARISATDGVNKL